MTAHVILDLSRLLSRAAFPAPTGIDRVELAYAQALIARRDDRLTFAAMHPLGRFAHLPAAASRQFVALTAARWRAPGTDDGETVRVARRLYAAALIRGQAGLREVLARRTRGAGRPVHLNVSHHHLDRPGVIEGALRRDRAAFACLVHDLIPIEFPEYARPTEPERHRRRVDTVARFADAVIVNSEATRRSLQPHLDRAGRGTPVLVAPLGIHPAPPALIPALTPGGDARPFFVLVSTIEPRKNHLLVLHLWRRLAEEMGPACPRLVLVGRRGWENENAVDMIERCPPLRGAVEERSAASDSEMAALLRGAAATLLPSFAEGYGLPLAESLAAGVPALCSDLPALREVGGDAPEYLDPLDGLGWLRAVRDYAAPGSARRAAQVARLALWRAPGWDAHMDAALAFIDAHANRPRA